MTRRSKARETELRAAAAVAYALDAQLIERDVPGAQQTRDFDLVFADGRDPEPLEITTFASQPELETWERLERVGPIPAPQLIHDWHLDVSAPITGERTEVLDVRQIRREVVPLLAALEAAGCRAIGYGQVGHDDAVTAARERLLALRVNDGWATAVAEGRPAQVRLSASVGGFRHPDQIAAGIEAEAAKEDNQRKLREPPTALRRHLAVIFDGSSGPNFVAAYLGSIGRLPDLPVPITTAWGCANETLLATTPPAAGSVIAYPGGSLTRQRIGFATDDCGRLRLSSWSSDGAFGDAPKTLRRRRARSSTPSSFEAARPVVRPPRIAGRPARSASLRARRLFGRVAGTPCAAASIPGVALRERSRWSCLAAERTQLRSRVLDPRARAQPRPRMPRVARVRRAQPLALVLRRH